MEAPASDSARGAVADFWDQVIAGWLDGSDVLSERLSGWFDSYSGKGAGQVTREGFPEPYLGDLRGSPRLLTLGLNPGRFVPELQARDGAFADEIRACGPYSAWAARNPYLVETWESRFRPNRYHQSRLRFARNWLQDTAVDGADIVTMELYPWHSTRVTAKMAPPADVIEEFVWQPLREVNVAEIFAFGKPWLRVCEALGLELAGRWGAGGRDLGSAVRSRAVAAFRLGDHQRVIVSWQSGYAGPPGPEDTARMRERITATP